MAEFEGAPVGALRRVVVVGSRFNEAITDPLVHGALDCLSRLAWPPIWRGAAAATSASCRCTPCPGTG